MLDEIQCEKLNSLVHLHENYWCHAKALSVPMICHPWSAIRSVQYVSTESGGLSLWSCRPLKLKPLYNYPIMRAFYRTYLDTPENGAEWAAEKPGHWTADDRCTIGRPAGGKKNPDDLDRTIAENWWHQQEHKTDILLLQVTNVWLLA